MANILNNVRNLFSPAELIPSGTYHYISPQDDPRNYRLHLRVEADGSGVLIINASTILHLNQTAAEYSYYLVQNLTPDEAATKMAKRYDTSPEQAKKDYQELIDRIQVLINTPDLDPVTFLGFDRKIPFSGHIPAPYRLDCAVTYRLPAQTDPESAPIDRVDEELDTDEWLKLIDKAMDVGIPHLVFTGGEPTLRSDLVDLLVRAEENNQVTGLITNGLNFTDQAYLDSLLVTGLDHLMMIFHPENDQSWLALENLLAADLFVAVHLTISKDNVEKISGLVERLGDMGVRAISLTTSDPELEEALQHVRDRISELDLELVWNLPVPYSASNPVALETDQSEEKEGSGRAWLYIEPDGDVLPAQGINRVLGNIIKDDWDHIWMKAHSGQ